MVDEDGPAWRVLDDELDQLHRRIGQASGGFHEEDGKVIRVCGEIPEDRPLPSYLVCGPDLLDPGDASSLEDWVAMRIEQRLGGVGRGGGVADGHVDVPTVGWSDEAAVDPSRSRVLGEGATGAKVGDGLPGADLEGSVVAAAFVAEFGDAGVIGWREYEGLLGEDWEDGGVGGGDGVEHVDGCIQHSMVVAVDVLAEQSMQWKGDSSASMVEPQEHMKECNNV